LTGPEAGFLLLSCRLGNPERKVLTTAQMRTLSQRMKDFQMDDPDRDLTDEDLVKLGYGRDMAQRILSLLEAEDLLHYYLRKARKAGCTPITRISPLYPQILRERLGDEAPGCIWARGDLEILKDPRISLVGSRDLNPKNAEFAREAGRQAALQGYTLVSGNARGADRTAQDACLAAGGKVISILSDNLEKHTLRDNMLYLGEEDFDQDFSSQRALSRNRCIHALGEKVLVAQSSFRHGGTWDGTVKNLRFHWSDVFCFADGSPAAELLCQMGANPVAREELSDLKALRASDDNFLGR
jgi:predicted Rossmann fold nucleotide-binding protein DprA/Smf involved in DNA uptake